MAFGTMSGQDMDRIIHELISFGYVGPNQGDKSDMVVSDMFMGADNLPSWIELVDVKFFGEDQPPVKECLPAVCTDGLLYVWTQDE